MTTLDTSYSDKAGQSRLAALEPDRSGRSLSVLMMRAFCVGKTLWEHDQKLRAERWGSEDSIVQRKLIGTPSILSHYREIGE